MTKMCFVSTVPATLEAFILPLAEYLDARGIEVTVVCDHDDQFAAAAPEYVRYLPVGMRRGFNVGGVAAVARLWGVFVRERFDLVQYSTPNASLYASVAAWLARVPVRLYGQWGIRYVGLGGSARVIIKQAERLVCALSTHVRAVSRKNMQFAIDEHLVEPGKIYLLGEGGTIGVTTAAYDVGSRASYGRTIREEYGLGSSFVFGFVGRLSVDKGIRELLEAVRILQESEDVRLMCVGSDETGPEQTTPAIEWARASDRVTFTGPVPARQLPMFYGAMDCYVHPAYREGFGMVLQEAAAMACPIVTSDVPGASEVMEPGVSCLLVQARDVEGLVAALSRVMHSELLRAGLGTSARTRVERHFERSEMLQRQYRDYLRLLGGGTDD